MTRPPPLSIPATTLWDFPSRSYGGRKQGEDGYVGSTPSYVIHHCLSRFTRSGDMVVDPFCGSGTTLDVAADLDRRAQGFDLAPWRDDIRRADARKSPVANGTVDLVFMDPPYGDHIRYSDDPACIGKIPSTEETFFSEMGKVFRESRRILKPHGHLCLYVCDFFNVRQGFSAVGFGLFHELLRIGFEAVDIVAVVRHNKDLEKGNFRKAAVEQGFFLRGFNYLFIVKTPAERPLRPHRRV